VAELKAKTKRLLQVESVLWLQRQNLMRRCKQRTADEKLNEHALRGDVRSLVKNINRFVKSGGAEDRKALLPFICDIMKSAANRNPETGHGSKGNRWNKTSKQILAVLKKKGHESLLRFFVSTLDGCSDSTAMAQWNKDKVKLQLGEASSNFKAVSSIYSDLMARLGIKGPVPYELGEDEAYMRAALSYDQSSDIVIGTCGLRGPDHECDARPDQSPLGSDLDAFYKIENAGIQQQRSSYMRGVVIEPLHPHLPALPVVLHCTCLKMDHEWVQKSWERV